jgi:uncharacterized protein YycO
MTKITIADMRVADIIVSTTGAAVSKGIREALGSEVSHAALVTGNSRVIEAIGSGVTEHSIADAYKEATLAIVLRRRNLNDQQRNAVVANARSFNGRAYDSIGAAGSGMSNKRGSLLASAGVILSPMAAIITARKISNNASDENKDDSFFCSELVARAFEMAGVSIVDGKPSYTNPRALRTAGTLIYVGHYIGG